MMNNMNQYGNNLSTPYGVQDYSLFLMVEIIGQNPLKIYNSFIYIIYIISRGVYYIRPFIFLR